MEILNLRQPPGKDFERTAGLMPRLDDIPNRDIIDCPLIDEMGHASARRGERRVWGVYVMWKTVRTAKYETRHKQFAKKKSKQLVQTLLNLELFEAHVQAGGRIKPFAFSFLHAEPMDVVAVDQSGGGKLPETRLYLWIDREAETVYLLTLGDKKTQHEDIQFCKSCVEHIMADPGFGPAEEGDHGQENSSDDGG